MQISPIRLEYILKLISTKCCRAWEKCKFSYSANVLGTNLYNLENNLPVSNKGEAGMLHHMRKKILFMSKRGKVQESLKQHYL